LLRSAANSPVVVWLEDSTLPDEFWAFSPTLSHLVRGAAVASLIGWMRFFSIHKLAVALCQYKSCIALFRAITVQATAPHHIQGSFGKFPDLVQKEMLA
jgi:hypothetical protein